MGKSKLKHVEQGSNFVKLKKDDEGYYQLDDIKLLNPIELLELLIDETSYQDTMNEVRLAVLSYINNI